MTDRAGGGKGAVQLASGEILATRTRWRGDESEVVCSRSGNGGTNWETLPVIVPARGARDLGDGDLLALPDGSIWYSYRDNSLREDPAGDRHYTIRIAVSHDAGQTWSPHSLVAESKRNVTDEPKALRGLWSSFLLRKHDGTIQCYFDDEDTPHREGFSRHQWITMKTWDEAAKSWVNPVTVARAHDPAHLSRDGMPGVAELPSGKLLCVFESVLTPKPHANCLRMVTSDDGGKTWGWRERERDIVFQTEHPEHLAVSPAIARMESGALICVFATDDNFPTLTKPGTPAWSLNTDVKCIVSLDEGTSWTSPAQTIFAGTHHTYAPGVLVLADGRLLVTVQDYSAHGHRAFQGEFQAER